MVLVELSSRWLDVDFGEGEVSGQLLAGNCGLLVLVTGRRGAMLSSVVGRVCWFAVCFSVVEGETSVRLADGGTVLVVPGSSLGRFFGAGL